MTFYEFLKFVHVLAAAAWVGGGIVMQILAMRARRSNDPGRIAAFSGDAEAVGVRVFMPAAIVLLVSGIWAALRGDLDFGQAWISIGFAAVIATLFLEMGFLGPESGRLKALIAERGPTDPDVGRRVGKILLLARIELVVLVVAVWAMVVKPG